MAVQKAGTNQTAEVYSDFFMYNPKQVGIAPDVIGLKVGQKIVPFVKYDDRQNGNFWLAQKDCPQIEVKSFFGKKYMVSLRNQHYEDKYLVMVKADIAHDYLLSFFNGQDFSPALIKNLTMPDDFVLSNSKQLLSQVKPVDFGKDCLG